MQMQSIWPFGCRAADKFDHGKRQAARLWLVTCADCVVYAGTLSRSDCLQFSEKTPRRQANQLNSGKSPRQSCCMLYVVKPLVRKSSLSFSTKKVKNCHRCQPNDCTFQVVTHCDVLHEIFTSYHHLALLASGHPTWSLRPQNNKIEDCLLIKLRRFVFLGHVGSIERFECAKMAPHLDTY